VAVTEHSSKPMKKLLLAALVSALLAPAVWADIKRTADGKPELSGNYNTATLTPLQRPTSFGDNLYLTREEAEDIVNVEKALQAEGDKKLDPNREAPSEGGDGSTGAAGNVGGYNSFWIDRGDSNIEIDGKFRTSIIYEPTNGRLPKMKPDAQARMTKRYASFRKTNTGTAWWLEEGDGSGPYDNPEDRTTSDRCLMGFGSTGGPPMLPVLYNNMKRIVQTPDTIMILVEMVHDARIIRLNSEHISPDIRKWMGDSIGWWEGDTLVIDTTNFNDKPGMYRGSRDLHVIERFTRTDGETLHYSFTVEDPNVWAEPWSGEYSWPASTDAVYEYACHEANYAMGNILRGARILEKDAKQATSGSD
jgi:hypothetical protein